eukprot:GEMP01001711.1.p1 GENE.GEMP01001711.1~~GEMP01001711.1.p1  ORF type:complete len:1583 (+),score=362.12 GEMP01001711.1:77-4825(+)
MLKYSFYGEDQQGDPQSEQRVLQLKYEDGLHLVEMGEEKDQDDDFRKAACLFEELIKELGNCSMTIDGIEGPVRHRYKERLREVCLKNLGLCLMKLNQPDRALRECFNLIVEDCKEVVLWLNAADAAKGANSLYAARYFASAPLQWKNLTSTEALLVKAKSREIEEWCQHMVLVGAVHTFSQQMLLSHRSGNSTRALSVYVEDRTIESLIVTIHKSVLADQFPAGEIVTFGVDKWPLTNWKPMKVSADVENLVRAVGQYLNCQGQMTKLPLEHIPNLVRTGGLSTALPDTQEVSDVEDFCRESVTWRTNQKRLLQVLFERRLTYMPRKMELLRSVLLLYHNYIINLHQCSTGCEGQTAWDFDRTDLPQPYPSAGGPNLKKFLSQTLVSAAETAFGCDDTVALQALMLLMFNPACSPFPEKVRNAFERCWKEPEAAAEFDAALLEINKDLPEKTHLLAMRMLSLLSHRSPQLLPLLENYLKKNAAAGAHAAIMCATHVIDAEHLQLVKPSAHDTTKEYVAPIEWVETTRGIKEEALFFWNRMRNMSSPLDLGPNDKLPPIDNELGQVAGRGRKLAELTAKLKKLGQQTPMKGQLFSTSAIGVTSWVYLMLIITTLIGTRVDLLPICQAGIVILSRHLVSMLREVTDKVDVARMFGLLVMFHDVDVALGVRFQRLAPKKLRTLSFDYPLDWVLDHEHFEGKVDFTATEISPNVPLPHLILQAAATMHCAKLEPWQRKARIPRRSQNFMQDAEVSRATAWALLRVLTAWIGGTKDPVLFEKDRLRDKALNNRSLESLREIAAPLGMYKRHVNFDEFRALYCDKMKPDEVEEAVTRFVAMADKVDPSMMFGSCNAGPQLDIQVMGLLWALQMALYARPAGTNCAARLLQHLNPLMFGEKTFCVANFLPVSNVVGYFFHPLVMPRFYILPLRMGERKNLLYPIMMEPIMRLVHKLSGNGDYWCDEMSNRLAVPIAHIWQQIAQHLEPRKRSRVDEWERAKLIYELLQQIEPVDLDEPLADIYLHCAMHSQGTDVVYLNQNYSFTRGSPTLLFCAQDLAHTPLRWPTLEIAASTYQIMFLGRRDDKCARHALNILDVLWFHFESLLQCGADFACHARKWFAVQRDRMWIYVALKQKPIAQQIAEDLLSFIANYTTCGLDKSFTTTGLNFHYDGPPIDFDNSLIFFLLCLTRVGANIDEAKRWTTTKYPQCIQLRAKIKEIVRNKSGRDELKKLHMKSVMGDDAAEYAAWIAVAGAYVHYNAHSETLRCLEKALDKRRHVETPSLEHTRDVVLNLQRYKYARKLKFNEYARRACRGFADALPISTPPLEQPWPLQCTAPQMEHVLRQISGYRRLPFCTILPVVQGQVLEFADYRWCVQVCGPNWSFVRLFHTLKQRQQNLQVLFEKACGQVYLDAAGFSTTCQTAKVPPGYPNWLMWYEEVEKALQQSEQQKLQALKDSDAESVATSMSGVQQPIARVDAPSSSTTTPGGGVPSQQSVVSPPVIDRGATPGLEDNSGPTRAPDARPAAPQATSNASSHSSRVSVGQNNDPSTPADERGRPRGLELAMDDGAQAKKRKVDEENDAHDSPM